MQLPSILQGESLTRLLQGAAVGAVATMFVGFYWGGWSLASTADKMAKERSELAVVAAMAPVCADKFRALPDADAKKVALSKVDSWKRRDEFPKELVTLPGESYPSSALVDACYTILFAPKSGEETREFLSKKADEGRDYAQRKARELRERADELIERGKDVAVRQKESISAAVEGAREAYRREAKS